MSDVEMQGLTRVIGSRPTATGAVILAFFDARVGGFMLRRCALVRNASGVIRFWEPKTSGVDHTKGSVEIIDGSLRKAVLAAALAAYVALGGNVGELPGDDLT